MPVKAEKVTCPLCNVCTAGAQVCTAASKRHRGRGHGKGGGGQSCVPMCAPFGYLSAFCRYYVILLDTVRVNKDVLITDCLIHTHREIMLFIGNPIGRSKMISNTYSEMLRNAMGWLRLVGSLK